MLTNSGTIHPAGHPERAKPHRILCVDDQEPVSKVLRCVLGQADYDVECAADGQEALNRIVADPAFFDLLITDHHMPRLSGLALVKHARAAGYHGRIIVYSSALSAQEIAHYRLLEVDHILPKPAKLATLLNCVDGPAAS